jgi:AbrB family looped-hinge helix DNA binding protein
MNTTTMTVKGQVTVPKHIRDALGLVPGTQVGFALNEDGEVVLRTPARRRDRSLDRFDAARGKADVKWRTQELMTLLRAD